MTGCWIFPDTAPNSPPGPPETERAHRLLPRNTWPRLARGLFHARLDASAVARDSVAAKLCCLLGGPRRALPFSNLGAGAAFSLPASGLRQGGYRGVLSVGCQRLWQESENFPISYSGVTRARTRQFYNCRSGVLARFQSSKIFEVDEVLGLSGAGANPTPVSSCLPNAAP